MSVVKARKQGNAVVLTVPATIKVEVNSEFYAIKNEDGGITYSPKIASIYDEDKYGQLGLYSEDEWGQEQELQGREII
jgi:hypothetical protein